MAFFKDLGKKIGTAAEAAADKAKEVADVSRLNSKISGEEKLINASFLEIGKTIFELHKDDPQSPVADLIAKITTSQKTIEDLKQQIEEVKNPKEENQTENPE